MLQKVPFFLSCGSFPFYHSLQNKEISDGVNVEVAKDTAVREKLVASDTQSAGARVDDYDFKESSPESVEVEESEDEEGEEEDEGSWPCLAQLLQDIMCDCILYVCVCVCV
jgi:hypothetical protein